MRIRAAAMKRGSRLAESEWETRATRPIKRVKPTGRGSSARAVAATMAPWRTAAVAVTTALPAACTARWATAANPGRCGVSVMSVGVAAEP